MLDTVRRKANQNVKNEQGCPRGVLGVSQGCPRGVLGVSQGVLGVS